MTHKIILVTGATGFIGRNFCIAAKKKGYDIIALSRNKSYAKYQLPDTTIITSLDELPSKTIINYVLNLAGEPLVAGRWNEKLKSSFIDSRLGVTNDLFKHFTIRGVHPEVVISGSAVGYYGAGDDNFIDEASEPKNSFSQHLCALWEKSASNFQSLGSRVCYLRTGIVLGEGEGALKRMIPAFKMGLGGKLGSGKQWFPWIHIEDQINLIFHCFEKTDLSGAVNACSPNPITNSDFTHTLGRVLSRPIFFNMPSAIAILVFGEMASELLLTGQRAIPKKAIDSGFRFNHEHIQEALEHILTN